MYAVSVSNRRFSWTHSAWDPTEPIATRPLFTTGSGNRKFFDTCDGNKNVSELVHFETRNGIAAHYDYAPFGAVTRSVSTSTITDNTFTEECEQSMRVEVSRLKQEFYNKIQHYSQNERGIPKFQRGGDYFVEGNYL